jgi:hypothetical protein
MDDSRNLQADALDGLVRAAYENDGKFCLLTFDRTLETQYGPGEPDPKAVREIKLRELKVRPSEKRYTRPLLVLQELLKLSRDEPNRRINAFVLSDGDMELSSDKPLFEKAAAAVSENPNIHCAVYFIRPQNRPVWLEAFRRKNLVLVGPTQAEISAAVDSVR